MFALPSSLTFLPKTFFPSMSSFHLSGKPTGDLNITLSLSKWVLWSEVQVCSLPP